MELSRRDALRASCGLVATAGVAGCIEQRVTSREIRVENGATWALTPEVGEAVALDADGVETYVEGMADRYGDGRGLGDRRRAAGRLRDGLRPATRRLPGDAGTARRRRVRARSRRGRPGGAASDRRAAVAVYEVDDGRLVRDVEVSVSRRASRFARDRSPTRRRSPPPATRPASRLTPRRPVGSRWGADRHRRGRKRSRRGRDVRRRLGGCVDGVQSINGVCEEERTGDHDFFWSVTAGYAVTERV
jgi:hypothetical protein